MHDVYGVDLDQRPCPLDSRSWRWWRVRLRGLLLADTRLHRALAPPPERGPGR